ncbi:MAG: hypothetical protein RIE86_25395 [Imperialibacter sp.]|uniref:hypothetical protein n=1 Tax=Imperialibacter sp. TaxID=2038411 RepID=UPI0032EB1406
MGLHRHPPSILQVSARPLATPLQVPPDTALIEPLLHLLGGTQLQGWWPIVVPTPAPGLPSTLLLPSDTNYRFPTIHYPLSTIPLLTLTLFTSFFP